MSDHEHIDVRTEDRVRVIELDNPPLNLLTEDLKTELLSAVRSFNRDDDARVLVTYGGGDRAFSAGRNLNESKGWLDADDTREAVGEAWDHGRDVLDAIDTSPKVTIAAIDGVALGGGAELALPFDVRVAAEDAEVGFPEVKRGLFPGTGGMEWLRQLVDDSTAIELLVTGDVLDAGAARRLGLVNRVVEGEAVAAALDLAAELAKRPPGPVADMKEVLRYYDEHPIEEARAFERRVFQDRFETETAREGIVSFFEDREPDFG